MRHYPDIAIYGRDGQLKLLVEAKSKTGTSEDWAARLRRNMYAHGRISNVPFFLLALPDRFYLWRPGATPTDPVPPDFSAESTPLLSPYLDRAGTSSELVTEKGLELAVSTWLEGLTSRMEPVARSENESWLEASGLLHAIQGGKVEDQTLV